MLSLSTKGRYATRIMVRLALTSGSHPTRIQSLADAEGISRDYVEQILGQLKAGGLVQSHRGAHGGFRLTRAPDEITVTDVLDATEGPIALVPCVGENRNGAAQSCDRVALCVTRPLWQRAGKALVEIFDATTVADLADDARCCQSEGRPMFEI